MHIYFFKSTDDKDSISRLSIFTTDVKKAFMLASKYFNRYNCKGVPQIIAV